MQIESSTLTIVGSVLGFGLALNAYFFKQMVNNLVNVDKGLAVLITKHERTEDDVKKNEETTRHQGKEISKLRDNMHEIKSDFTSLALNLQLSCSKLADSKLVKEKRIKND